MAQKDQDTRTLEEISEIVAAIKAGIPVGIDYFDEELDENPYVVRPCW